MTRQEDVLKTTLNGVSDMVSLEVGGTAFLAVASSAEDGLTTYRVGADGSMTKTDALTAKDGLWVDGVDVLAAASLGATRYVIAGSVNADNLSVMRINNLGVMFVTDQMLDDRNTRFGGVSQIEVVQVGGRCLVLAGGSDGGISLLELMPDGRLFHHASLEARDDWSAIAGGLTGLSARLDGTRLEIFAAGSGGVVQMQVSLANLGTLVQGTRGNDALTGGGADDLIFGGLGRDTLSGGGGSDMIFGNNGNDFLNGGFGFDRMNGGTGADQFFHQGVADHGSDWIQDYAAAEGDVLVFGPGGANPDQFQVNFAHTADPLGVRAGSADVAEAFVIWRPTGQILWALVDGGANAQINLQIGGQVFDLLA